MGSKKGCGARGGVALKKIDLFRWGVFGDKTISVK